MYINEVRSETKLPAITELPFILKLIKLSEDKL